MKKLVRQWHAPTRKLLDLREVDNLSESMLDSLSYTAQKLRSNPRDSVDNVVVFYEQKQIFVCARGFLFVPEIYC